MKYAKNSATGKIKKQQVEINEEKKKPKLVYFLISNNDKEGTRGMREQLASLAGVMAVRLCVA